MWSATTRLFAISQPMPKAKPLVRAATDAMTPDVRAGDFAQAMMDLGSTICTPRKPACALCPLMELCDARVSGEQERYPVKAPKGERPSRAGAIFYVRRVDGFVLVRTRAPKGLLGGMTEFPGTLWSADFDVAQARALAPMDAQWRRLAGAVQHVFTHFALSLSVFRADVAPDVAAPGDCRWVREDELEGEAMPSVMRKVITHAQ